MLDADASFSVTEWAYDHAERARSLVWVRGREIRQSRVQMAPGGKLYLLRVVVDMRRDIDEVVTVYKTSRIEKYWSRR